MVPTKIKIVICTSPLVPLLGTPPFHETDPAMQLDSSSMKHACSPKIQPSHQSRVAVSEAQ
jgi:hypothetical protein